MGFRLRLVEVSRGAVNVVLRGHDFENAVRTHAEVVVAELLDALRRQRNGKLSPLDQQVIVAEPVPLRELHPRSRPPGDRRSG